MTYLAAQLFLNHRLELSEIEWQIEQLAKAGYDAVYPHARQGLLTPYMSKDWWEVIEVLLDGCRRHGLELWLWDEDYFPSGLAGGRVVWDNPGLIARQLQFQVISVEGGGPFEVDFDPGMLLEAFIIKKTPDNKLSEPIKITDFCGTRRQSWDRRQVLHRAYSPQVNSKGHPHWRTTFSDNRFALSWNPDEVGEYLVVGVLITNNEGVHPDILNPEAVKAFIALSHEEYHKRLGTEFGKTVKGVFTDEPSPGAILFPWTKYFSEEFYQEHGYDLLEYLPHLALDINSRSAAVRYHYRLTQHRLQYQSYVQQIADWCQKHGLKMAGHLTRTEWFSLVSAWWPNELRCYKDFDIPCTDPLGASCGWKETSSYHSGIKVASSAAHLFDRLQAGSDALAVVGDEASLRDLKYMLDYQMVLGINYFNVHGLSYSLDGPRKDEVPPSLFYQHSQWKQMPTLLNYVKQTCEELTGGTHICKTAILYPSTSLACQLTANDSWPSLDDELLIHELVEFLLSHQRDFDFIDEITLSEKISDDGELMTPEKYEYLILPYLRYIDDLTTEALVKFANAGGTVIVIGSIPLALTRDSINPIENWVDKARINFYREPDCNILKILPGLKVEGDGKEDIFVLERQKEERRLIFVFNRQENYFKGKVEDTIVSIPPRGSVLLKNSSTKKNLVCCPETVLPDGSEIAVDLSTGWKVKFEQNQLPLNFWHPINTNGDLQSPFTAPGFDLLKREMDPTEGTDGIVKYFCRFMLTGHLKDAKLVIEESGFSGNWKLYVNEIPIENWQQQRVFDSLNMVADIGHAIKGGSTPTLNVVTVEVVGGGLEEIPYLCGNFSCEYRYGHASFPFLKAREETMQLDILLPWDVIGYPTFSGVAFYQQNFKLEQRQELWLDLGRVEDLAVVKIDNEPPVTLAWPPYSLNLGILTPGMHQLSVEVINPPANRTRMARLPAGLLGPVRLLRKTDRS